MEKLFILLALITDEIWLKPYVDLQPYEDPCRGVLEFTKELDPSLVNIENVIGEGENHCFLLPLSRKSQFLHFSISLVCPLAAPQESLERFIVGLCV